MAIVYQDNLNDLNNAMLTGFFVGWPNPPGNDTLYKILENSSFICLALDKKRVVGFITAISDGVISAYIPLLEVLPEYQNLGIGKKLIQSIQRQTEHLYMLDLCCDNHLTKYYEELRFTKSNGMIARNYNSLKQ